MPDLEIRTDDELMVAHVESDTEAGVEFLDGYFPSVEFTVVDSGRIMVHLDGLPALAAAAKEHGLTTETVN